MPITEGVNDEGVSFYRWGNRGAMYTWKTEKQRVAAKQKAIRQGYAIEMSKQRKKHPNKTPKPVHLITKVELDESFTSSSSDDADASSGSSRSSRSPSSSSSSSSHSRSSSTSSRSSSRSSHSSESDTSLSASSASSSKRRTRKPRAKRTVSIKVTAAKNPRAKASAARGKTTTKPRRAPAKRGTVARVAMHESGSTSGSEDDDVYHAHTERPRKIRVTASKPRSRRTSTGKRTSTAKRTRA